MLTKLEHKLLEYTTFITSVSLVFPFILRSNNNKDFIRVATNRSIWRKCLEWLSLLSTITHSIYLSIRFIPGFGYKTTDFVMMHFYFILHSITLLTSFMVLIVQIFAKFHVDELTFLINQLLHFNIAQGKRLLGMEFIRTNWREKIICSIALSLMILGVAAISLIAIFPVSKHNLFSVLQINWQTWWAFGFLYIIEVYCWFKAILVNWFIFYIGFVYIMTNRFWLSKICFEWMKGQEGSDSRLRCAGIRVYRSLIILNTTYNTGWSSALLPALKSNLEVSALFCLFVTLRLYHVTELWMYCLFPFCALYCLIQLVTTISYMASIPEISSELTNHFNHLPLNTMDRRALKRDVWSCKIIFCKIGSLFFIEKSTKLAYFSLLANSLISILLTI